ncbi:MAG: hypothetical protein SGJ21_13935 [Alphaproteobacteria bacterium]|nr:hypothetical protein [Alphaproteobacteria bacterium]
MARALLLIGLMQFLALLVGVLRQKGLSVFLGPEGLGIVGTIDQIVLLVVQLGAFGLPFTALKFMSQAQGESAAAFRHVSNRFLRLITLLSVSATLLCGLALALWPQLSGPKMAPYTNSLLVAVLGIAPLMIASFLVNVLASARRPLAGSALGLVVAAISAASAIIGATMGGTIGLYVGSTAAGLVTTLGALVYLDLTEGISFFRRPQEQLSADHRTPAIGVTALSVYVTMIAYTGMLLAVRYGVLAVAGEREAGILHAALTVSLTAGSLLAAMTALYLAPTLNRLKDAEEKQRHTHMFAGRILALFMLGAVPLVLFPQLAMTILYTHAFHPSAVLIAGFLVWQCLYQLMNVYLQLLVGLDEMPFMALAASTGLCVAAALTVALAGVFGSSTVWIGLSIGAVLSGGLMIARLRARHGLRIPPHIIVRLGLLLGAIALGHVLFNPATENTMSGVAARLTFALIAFGLLVLQMQNEERALIHGVVTAARRRLGLTA